MGHLDGRVAIVTGGGRGLGREHALLLAAEGARVVVNDPGAAIDGSGSDVGPAQAVVDEIEALGGKALANTDSVAEWAGADRLVQSALEHFGELHVVVNNAGILRDRMLVSMSEEDWDAVIAVHLKGTFAVTHWAAVYWREQSKAGTPKAASVINTSSSSGLFGIPGQTNYGAAKAGILTLSLVAATELSRYGVRVNAICPEGRTRLSVSSPGVSDAVRQIKTDGFDRWDPANVSPLVAYLATADCPLTGQVYEIGGSRVSTYKGWTKVDAVDNAKKRWTVDELASALHSMPTDLNPLFGAS